GCSTIRSKELVFCNPEIGFFLTDEKKPAFTLETVH
ncbi:MAG: hypothetical protein ACI81W_001578, partial [Saprospiraceae bacterium]